MKLNEVLFLNGVTDKGALKSFPPPLLLSTFAFPPHVLIEKVLEPWSFSVGDLLERMGKPSIWVVPLGCVTGKEISFLMRKSFEVQVQDWSLDWASEESLIWHRHSTSGQVQPASWEAERGWS